MDITLAKKSVAIVAIASLMTVSIPVQFASAAIAFGSVTSGANSDNPPSSTTFVLNKPSSTSSGDFLVAIITFNGGDETSITAPSGWTLIERTDGSGSNDDDIGLATYYRVAGASEGASYTWNLANSGSEPRASGGIVRYTGVHTVSPVDAKAENEGSSDTPSAPTVTTTATNDRVLVIYSIDNDNSVSAPSGTTQRINQTNSDNNGPRTLVADFTQASAGATGAKTLSDIGNTEDWVTQTIALRESDTTAPTIAQVTAVPSPTNDSTPNYTFSSTEAGTITYGGSCTSATTAAVAGNNTITFNTLADGTYSNCTITVTDASSNASTPLSVNTFTIDTAAPAAPVISSPANNTRVNSAGVTVSGTAEANATVVISGGSSPATTTANGSGNWSTTVFLNYGSNVDTTNNLSAKAIDAAGNNSSATSLTIVMDNTTPDVTITSGTSNPTNASPISITMQFSEDVSGFVVGDITVSGGTASNFVAVDSNTYTADLTPASDPATVQASIDANKAFDQAGNGNDASNTLSRNYDATGPGVTITNPADGSYKNTGTITATFTVTGGTSSQCAVDGGSFGACTSGSSHNLSGLLDGSHSFSVKALDDATNETTATNTFTVDTVPPVPTITSPTTTPATTRTNPIPVTVSFTEAVTDFVAGDVVVGGGSVAGFSGSGSSYSFNVTPSGNGVITVDIAAGVANEANGSGNTNGAATQLSITYDTDDAPIIDPISSMSATVGTNVTFSASSTDPDGLPVTYTLTGAPSGASIGASSGAFTWDTTGVTPGSYVFEVVASDGTLSAQTSVTVTLAAAPASTPSSPNNPGDNGPIVGSTGGQVLGASIGPSSENNPGSTGQVLGASTSTATSSAVTTTASTTTPACGALITKVPMKQGSSRNDIEEVKKLQNFLNGEMATSLAVDGVFGASTRQAVNAFQTKYASEILAPWGLASPTGVVYILTQWKVNMINCPTLNLAQPSVR